MKKTFILIVFAFIFLPLAAYALEVDFPEINGVKPGEAFGPANWINYLFVFGLAIVGLAIIGSLVYAGFQWMFGAESPSKISAAKDRIWGAVIGLVILFGSYVFLRTINPELVSLRNPRLLINVEGHWRDYYRNPSGTGSKLNGDSCATNDECISERCAGDPKKCTAKAQPGEECKTTNDCKGTDAVCSAEKKCEIVEDIPVI